VKLHIYKERLDMVQGQSTWGNNSVAEARPYSVDLQHKSFSKEKLVKLDANEFPEDAPQSIKQAYESVIKEIDLSKYPDPASTELREQLSVINGVSANSIVVGSGSDELLANIFLAFSGCSAVLETVGYPVYRHLAKINKIDCHFLKYNRETFSSEDYFFDSIARRKPELVCIGYPNNPTGTLVSADAIRQSVLHCPETLFVVDEAYYEYSNKTLAPLALSRDNVLVLRTLSKAYGLAGLRVGYAIGGDRAVEMLNKVKLPYNLNAISQCITARVLALIFDEMPSRIAKAKSERDRLLNDLRSIGGKVIESHANFLFVNLNEVGECRFLYESLRQHGIFIRAWSVPEEEGWFRVSVGSKFQNDALINSLKALKECRKF